MFYRIISRLLATRLKPILPRLVGLTQCAFVPGRAITDVDDLILFGEASLLNAQRILSSFSRIYGLKVNARKSVVVFGGTSVDIAATSGVLRVAEGHFPHVYMGFPLISKCLSKVHCAPLLTKLRARPAGWRRNFLAMTGRCQLI